MKSISIRSILEEMGDMYMEKPKGYTSDMVLDGTEAQLLQLLESKATLDYLEANSAGKHVKWSKAIPLSAINEIKE